MRIPVVPGKIREVDFDYIDREMNYTRKELEEFERAIGTAMESEKRKAVIRKREDFYESYKKGLI